MSESVGRNFQRGARVLEGLRHRLRSTHPFVKQILSLWTTVRSQGTNFTQSPSQTFENYTGMYGPATSNSDITSTRPTLDNSRILVQEYIRAGKLRDIVGASPEYFDLLRSPCNGSQARNTPCEATFSRVGRILPGKRHQVGF